MQATKRFCRHQDRYTKQLPKHNTVKNMATPKKKTVSPTHKLLVFLYLDALLVQGNDNALLYGLLEEMSCLPSRVYFPQSINSYRNSLWEENTKVQDVPVYEGKHNWNMNGLARFRLTRELARDVVLSAEVSRVLANNRFKANLFARGAHHTLAIFCKNDNRLRPLKNMSASEVECEARYMYFSMADFSLDWVRSRTPLAQSLIFFDLCTAFMKTGMVHPLLGQLADLYDEGKIDCPWLEPEKIALLQFWRNNLDKAEAAAAPLRKSREVTLDQLAVLLTIDCFQKNPASMQQLTSWIKLFKKGQGTRQMPSFFFYPGLVFNLVRFLYGTPKDLEAMSENYWVLQKADFDNYGAYACGLQGLGALAALDRFRNGAIDNNTLSKPSFAEEDRNALSVLATASARLRLVKESDPDPEVMRNWYLRCEGLPSLQRCFADILHAIPGYDKDGSWARDDSCSLLNMADLVQDMPVWQFRLAALEKIASTDAPEERKKRLFWVVDFSERRVYAKEQVLGVRGWSKGKDVSLKRLAERSGDVDYLTDVDWRIAAGIEQERSWWTPVYVLHLVDCCEALCQSNMVFEQSGNSYKPIRFVKANLTFNLKDNGSNGYFLKLGNSEAFENYRGQELVISRKDDVISVYKLGPTEKQVAGLLANGLTFPKSELSRVLGLTRSKLNIDVETEGVEAEDVEEVTTPVLQLEQTASGFEGVCGVRPFGLPGTAFFQTATGIETPLATVPLEIPASPSAEPEPEPEQTKGKRGTKSAKSRAKASEGKTPPLEEDQPENAPMKTVRVERNFGAEQAALDNLVKACPTLAQGLDNGHWFSGDLEEVLTLLEELRKSGVEHSLEWPKGMRLKLKGQLDATSIKARIGWTSNDWFGISGTAQLDDNEMIPLTGLLNSLKGSRFVSLGDGEYVALTADLRRKLSSLKLVTSETKKGDYQVNALASAAVEQALADMEVEVDPKWENNLERMHRAFATTPAVPSLLRADLREYQREGYEWMQRLAIWGVGACLADDMGLGKTVQSIAVLLNQAAHGPCLVVAPTSVCGNWDLEIGRFAPSLNVVRFGHTGREATVKALGPNDVLVMGYGLLPNVQPLLAKVQWSMVIFDEAQALKNAATKRAKAGKKIQADFRLALTGTPIENSIDDLWSLFNIINPGLLGSWENFTHRYGQAATPGTPASKALRAVVRPFLLRRLKSSVLDELPEKTEQNIIVEPNPKELAFYETLRRRAVEKLHSSESSSGAKRIEILAELTRLRRACCHPGLADPDMMKLEKYSSKTLTFLETVQDLIQSGHKVLAFSQFTTYLALIREALEEKGISFQYLDGQTPELERKKRVAAFQSGQGDVFLLSLKAGGTGLNLTAADYVIHLDPWWNPAVEDQASDRAHRIGQKRPVTIYRMVQQGSVEEKILALHQSKRELAADFLEGTETSVKSLTEEDLLRLLQ